MRYETKGEGREREKKNKKGRKKYLVKKCREKKKRRHKQSRSKIHSREDSPFLPPPSNHSRIVEFTDRVLTYPSIHESVGGDRIFLSSMLSIIALHRYVYMYVYIYISAFTSTRFLNEFI